jgi:hypothetical protein
LGRVSRSAELVRTRIQKVAAPHFAEFVQFWLTKTQPGIESDSIGCRRMGCLILCEGVSSNA